ncbi:LamG domain-containing protein [Fimbriimonas ginsengisoli]|nr:LamG domain-containing protein [Fimbriimonas ginsengisoli]
MAFMLAARQEIVPALWLDLKGNITVAGRPVTPRITPGANRFRGQDGVTYNFSGQHGGVLFDDLPALKLTGSMTVSTWIYPRSYVNDGPGAQILFRGDDRCGYDTYWMVVEGDGTINFAVGNERDQQMKVKAELPLNRWTHITATFDVKTGELAMWFGDERVAYAHTSRRPFANLDPKQAPGVGIGNVQNNLGPHNQPFNGMLADLRLYPAVLTPEEAGFNGRPRVENP